MTATAPRTGAVTAGSGNGDAPPRRASIAQRTLRTDRWWLQPLLTVVALLPVVGLDENDLVVAAAGAATGRLAVYRIHGETGALTPLATYAVGQRPMAVLVT